MTDQAGKRGERQAALRAKRSAAALRENLKRRKAQEKAWQEKARQEKARRQGEGRPSEPPHESAQIAPEKPKL